jgi:transketolase C-terminal domain/subunit
MMGNLTKLVSNSYLDVTMGVPAAYVVVGMTMTIGTHALFGGLGGGIAAVLLGRLYKSGIVERNAKRSGH